MFVRARATVAPLPGGGGLFFVWAPGVACVRVSRLARVCVCVRRAGTASVVGSRPWYTPAHTMDTASTTVVPVSVGGGVAPPSAAGVAVAVSQALSLHPVKTVFLAL